MFLLFSIVFTNAIRRYTIGKSFTWGDELSIFIAIYGVMFASAVAYIQDRHIRFTMLVGFLSRKWLHMLYCFVDLMMVAIGGLLAYSGWMFTLKRGGMEVSGLITLAKTLRSLTGWENMIVFGHYFPYQAAICFGGILLAIAACLKLCLRVTEIGKRSWGKHEDL
ncbi:TRAP transporter small permease [Desulfogranum japonicum]|uniref:TRAP transporter small permease n=1 Tax=Desulfogranum japonicum TaxID=231447 RepID=UPI0004068927|nr:TRAP transporter small permease [Desulfogranum japonicum]